MSTDVTTSYAQAQQWAIEIIGDPNVLQIWIPEAGFIRATRTADSISFTRKDDVCFGFGVGPNPPIESDWERFSLSRSLPREKTAGFKLLGQLNVYAIDTASFINPGKVVVLENRDADINAFLDDHAPHSSSRPGDLQSLFWCGITNETNNLMAVATIARWESGGLMLSSVATHTDMRKQGLGTQITVGTLAFARERGLNPVALGVTQKNTAAISIYERIGFSLLCAFNTFSRD